MHGPGGDQHQRDETSSGHRGEQAARQADARALAAILGDWVRETGWMPLLHSRDEDLAFVRGLIGRGLVTVADDDGPQGFLAREGEEVTALYLARMLRPLGLRVTRLASGLPAGGDLEYADELTLGRALEGRREV